MSIFNERRLRRPSLWGVGLSSLAFILLCGYSAEVAEVDPGRGAQIEACPTDYDGMVKVADPQALSVLGRIASDRHIIDVKALNPNSRARDLATLPGELACNAIANNGTGQIITVLLPSGMDALDRGSSDALIPGKSALPDGLNWRS